MEPTISAPTAHASPVMALEDSRALSSAGIGGASSDEGAGEAVTDSEGPATIKPTVTKLRPNAWVPTHRMVTWGAEARSSMATV